ncbi:MAG TPA: methyl-accepting chemotaxis protein [Paenibacillus sp.]|uniref:methyl-accepting chemotaxis protein n=1 Tax=Paenibacillus sp. TaxID=58172 RepID=UPI0028D54C12|nr:methyl-accepting chemotaxis protein [Paenibacillus sp.]HUC92984.1 methyl-accepting chemotaxis protein [Paenibacillus sp.]
MFVLFRTSVYRQMNEQFTQLASGDFTGKSDTRAVRDTPMLQPLRRMIRSLTSVIRVVDHTSRNLHRRMEIAGQQSESVKEQVETVTATIREMAEGMQDASEHLTDMADEMNRVHGYLTEVGQYSDEVAREARHYAGEAAAGRKEIMDAMDQMEAIRGEGMRLREEMSSLEGAVQRIALLTKTIEEISAQTQLLALNANIEAARAGAEGLGFAVVAREVSKLAVQARDETGSIQDAIKAVTSNTLELKQSIDEMQVIVGDGERIMSAASLKYEAMEGYLGQIVEQMASVDGKLKEITGSTLAMTDAANQTSAMIEEVAAGTEEVLASAEIQQSNLAGINETIQDAYNGSLSLRSVISQFKLPSPSDSHPIQKEVDRWMECAMGIRAIMVAMMEADGPDAVREWHRRKEQQESVLKQCWDALAARAQTERDKQYCQWLGEAWEAFDVVKNRNAAWMLEGNVESARQSLVTAGRERFKAAMDIANEWMES